jgi:hypothetical protein
MIFLICYHCNIKYNVGVILLLTPKAPFSDVVPAFTVKTERTRDLLEKQIDTQLLKKCSNPVSILFT